MPHLLVNRNRYFGIVEGVAPRVHLSWEIGSGLAYFVGGVIFVAGSVFFLPQFEDRVAIGSWLFLAGSLFYLSVSTHDLLEVHAAARHFALAAEDNDATPPSHSDDDGGGGDNNNKNEKSVQQHQKIEKWSIYLDWAAASMYETGTFLFIIGSVLFLPSVGLFVPAAWTFIWGSVLFIAGAVVNAVQIFESPTSALALLANLTAVTYIIGSTFFLTGSVPYLWTFQSEEDAELVYDFLGWQFIVGSLFFVAGGVVNLVRIHVHHLQVVSGKIKR